MKKITLTQEELEREIKRAFVHGQGNAEMMKAGLERDETEDYVNSRMRSLLNHTMLEEINLSEFQANKTKSKPLIEGKTKSNIKDTVCGERKASPPPIPN